MDERTKCRRRDTGIDRSNNRCSSLDLICEALVKNVGVVDQVGCLEPFNWHIFDAERTSVGADESMVIASTERDDHWSHEEGIYRSRLHSCCDE